MPALSTRISIIKIDAVSKKKGNDEMKQKQLRKIYQLFFEAKAVFILLSKKPSSFWG